MENDRLHRDVTLLRIFATLPPQHAQLENQLTSAFNCDFNRSMQHLISDYREEDVENEAATENLLHRNR